MNFSEDKTPQQFLMVSKEDLRTELVNIVEEMMQKPAQKVWISTEEAMGLLQLKSKSSMQKLRDSGAVEFSQPMKKIIVYRYSSILEYLERHSRKTF